MERVQGSRCVQTEVCNMELAAHELRFNPRGSNHSLAPLFSTFSLVVEGVVNTNLLQQRHLRFTKKRCFVWGATAKRALSVTVCDVM